VRVEILRTLAALGHSRRGEALALGLGDPAPTVRAEALQLAAQEPTDEVLGQLPRFLEEGVDIGLRQAALAVAGRIPGTQAASILRAWLDRLGAGNVDPRLVLDLTEAVRGRPEADLKSSLAAHDASHPLDDTLAGYRIALVGGRGTAGRTVFADKADVSCQRCHSVAGVGGTVGPALDGVGKRLRREDILESILKPNARIATGFEQAQITMRDGATHAGVVRRESDTELWVESLEDGVVRLAKSDIIRRARGLSAMPEGLGRMLTLRELRDLVEYLSGL
jgi:quinoprotein glucose dehydrogenase